MDKAAQLSLNPLTAWALLEQSEAQNGEWIIVSAGSSAVNKLLLQFAKEQGIKTMTIVRNESQTKELYRLGAHGVIQEFELGNIEHKIKSLVGNERIRCFIDAVGGDVATNIIPYISENGKIICYGMLSQNRASYFNADIIFKFLTISGFGIDTWISKKTDHDRMQCWNKIITNVQKDDFTMAVAGKFPLEKYKEAIITSKSTPTGKVLLTF